MKKIIPFILILMMFLLFSLEGCQKYDMYPISSEIAAASARETFQSPEEALDKIYTEIEISGINPLSAEVLSDKFGVDTTGMYKIWGRYSEGRFGLSDVYIIRPAQGQLDTVRRILEDIKLARTVEFRSYDVYNALQIAENGTVFEVGEYVVLLMLEDNETAQTILEDSLKAI